MVERCSLLVTGPCAGLPVKPEVAGSSPAVPNGFVVEQASSMHGCHP